MPRDVILAGVCRTVPSVPPARVGDAVVGQAAQQVVVECADVAALSVIVSCWPRRLYVTKPTAVPVFLPHRSLSNGFEESISDELPVPVFLFTRNLRLFKD